MPAASPDPSSVTQSGRFLSSETLSLAAEAFRSAVFSISLVISSGMVRAGAVLAAGRAAAGAWGAPAVRKAVTWRRVRIEPSCSGVMRGADGSFSWSSESMATRLMESMPRSDSMSISWFSDSAG